MGKITSSLIISTYNWPEALQCCLKNVRDQSVLPDEIIIADDGSTDETKRIISDIANDFPVTIVHVWQPDEGFQLSKIRNKAIAKCRFEYIIQVDGDLILHRDFIKDHLSLAKLDYFITGSRVLLNQRITCKILQTAQDAFKINHFTGKNSNFLNGIRIGFVRRLLSLRYKTKGRNKYYVKGCNMSFWLKDLITVNGYNEAFTGWGKEDSELAIRLINAGVKKQFLKAGGICYHLFHPESSRELEERNTRIMNDAMKDKIIRVKGGLEQYFK